MNVRYLTESARQTSSLNEQLQEMHRFIRQRVQVAKIQSVKGNAEVVGHQIYTQLMNGVSHMLPFVVGGGILIALAFLIDGLSVDMNSLPADQRANFGTITPVAAMLKGIGGAAFAFMLPILAGFIAMAIGDRPALAVGFVGGMIASQGKSGFLGALVAGFAAGYSSLYYLENYVTNFLTGN